MKKKLMLLGGIRYLLPVIEAAHKMGVYVITADYLPDNIAHKYSDEYVNVSIIDREAVLKVAQEKKIDGILSFGVDPGVVTAAYVAEKMGLPTPPLKSVEILQNKDKFRDFLEKNGFNCPWHRSFASADEAMEFFRSTTTTSNYNYFPCIVKPVDSAGSKGCSRVDRLEDLAAAVEYARSESHNGRIIVEQFLELVGHQTGSDSFSIDKELVFCSFDNQYFDSLSPNTYTPSAHLWPSDMPDAAQTELRAELQRLIRLLNMGTSIYNIEARVATDGKPYIMEVSPRGGGNRLSEILKFATGQDLIANDIRFALGFPVEPMFAPIYDGVWVDFVIHSNKTGRFVSVMVDPAFRAAHVKEECIYVKPDDKVAAFDGANQAIGTLFLKFNSHEQAEEYLVKPDSWVKVNVS